MSFTKLPCDLPAHRDPAHPTEEDWPSETGPKTSLWPRPGQGTKRTETLVWKTGARTGHFISRLFTKCWKAAGINKGRGHGGVWGVVLCLAAHPTRAFTTAAAAEDADGKVGVSSLPLEHGLWEGRAVSQAQGAQARESRRGSEGSPRGSHRQASCHSSCVLGLEVCELSCLWKAKEGTEDGRARAELSV